MNSTRHIMKIKDGFHTGDIGGFRGEVEFGIGRTQIPFTDVYGKKSYYSKFKKILYRDKNIVPIGGYQFAFNKLFNIGLDQESTLRVGDLNDEAPQMKIGVHRGEYNSIYYDAEVSTSNGSMVVNPGVNISALNFVFGFMVGDGGAREDNMTAISPDYKRRTLYRAIPFRMSNDGTTIPDGKYFGKAQTFTGTTSMEPITSYFIKKFDTPPPHIVHAWASDNNDWGDVSEESKLLSIVDDSVYASTSSVPVESYVEINFSIDKNDGRGFFTSTDASPRINEFGLVTGWYNSIKAEYESIRLFTHFTRPSIALSEGDSIEVIYRLYAR